MSFLFLYIKNKKKHTKIIIKERMIFMKFIKGAMIGSLVATGIYMVFSENESAMRKKMIKKGKSFVKKMGII